MFNKVSAKLGEVPSGLLIRPHALVMGSIQCFRGIALSVHLNNLLLTCRHRGRRIRALLVSNIHNLLL